MSEGRNRQIRRTFAALGYEVTALHRIEFGKYQLGDLKPGQYIEVKKQSKNKQTPFRGLFILLFSIIFESREE